MTIESANWANLIISIALSFAACFWTYENTKRKGKISADTKHFYCGLALWIPGIFCLLFLNYLQHLDMRNFLLFAEMIILGVAVLFRRAIYMLRTRKDKSKKLSIEQRFIRDWLTISGVAAILALYGTICRKWHLMGVITYDIAINGAFAMLLFGGLAWTIISARRKTRSMFGYIPSEEYENED